MKTRVRPFAGRKAVVDFHINENTITDSSRPVDYSFFKYKELKRKSKYLIILTHFIITNFLAF